jgi:hypothetical protein
VVWNRLLAPHLLLVHLSVRPQQLLLSLLKLHQELACQQPLTFHLTSALILELAAYQSSVQVPHQYYSPQQQRLVL